MKRLVTDCRAIFARPAETITRGKEATNIRRMMNKRWCALLFGADHARQHELDRPGRSEKQGQSKDADYYGDNDDGGANDAGGFDD